VNAVVAIVLDGSDQKRSLDQISVMTDAQFEEAARDLSRWGREDNVHHALALQSIIATRTEAHAQLERYFQSSAGFCADAVEIALPERVRVAVFQEKLLAYLTAEHVALLERGLLAALLFRSWDLAPVKRLQAGVASAFESDACLRETKSAVDYYRQATRLCEAFLGPEQEMGAQAFTDAVRGCLTEPGDLRPLDEAVKDFARAAAVVEKQVQERADDILTRTDIAIDDRFITVNQLEATAQFAYRAAPLLKKILDALKYNTQAVA